MERHQGVTLIELMSGVAIIGVLAAVVLPAHQTYTKISRLSAVVLAPFAVKTAANTVLAGATAGTHIASVTIKATSAVIKTSSNFSVDCLTSALTTTAASGLPTLAHRGYGVAAGIC